MKKRKEEELKKMIEEVRTVAKLAAEEEQKAETEESVLKETEVRKSSDLSNAKIVDEKESVGIA